MTTPRVHSSIQPIISKFLLKADGSDFFEISKKLRTVINDDTLTGLRSATETSCDSVLSDLLQNGAAMLLDSRVESFLVKIAGFAILDCLLDINDDRARPRRVEISNIVKEALEKDCSLEANVATIPIGAHVIGRFALTASTSEVDSLRLFFNFMASYQKDSVKYAGFQVVSQLAQNAPALIFASRNDVLRHIWIGIKDGNSRIRGVATETLVLVFTLVSQREDMSQLIVEAIAQIKSGFVKGEKDSVLSSLVILQIIIGGKVVSLERLRVTMSKLYPFEEVVWEVLKRKNDSNPDIRTKIIDMLPSLVTAFPSTFLLSKDKSPGGVNFLTYSVRHLLDCVHQKGRLVLRRDGS